MRYICNAFRDGLCLKSYCDHAQPHKEVYLEEVCSEDYSDCTWYICTACRFGYEFKHCEHLDSICEEIN